MTCPILQSFWAAEPNFNPKLVTSLRNSQVVSQKGRDHPSLKVEVFPLFLFLNWECGDHKKLCKLIKLWSHRLQLQMGPHHCPAILQMFLPAPSFITAISLQDSYSTQLPSPTLTKRNIFLLHPESPLHFPSSLLQTCFFLPLTLSSQRNFLLKEGCPYVYSGFHLTWSLLRDLHHY